MKLLALTIAPLSLKVLVVASSRLLFSPLRAYPGPLLARLTNGYAGWHAVKGDIHLVTYLHHLKYGKTTADWELFANPRHIHLTRNRTSCQASSGPTCLQHFDSRPGYVPIPYARHITNLDCSES